VAVIGQQVSVTGTLANHQEVLQDYAFIVQITDEEETVVFIAWQEGAIESGSTEDVAISWTPESAGNYTVTVFIWDGLHIPPAPLSAVTTMNITVDQE
jgi:hypothetical protein